MASTLVQNPTHHVSTSDKESADALNRILHTHHEEHALLWDMNKFIKIAPENRELGIHIVHSPHLLASLQRLGAPPERLQEVYESESKILLQPENAQGTITTDNWRAFLGDRTHTREYLDFFERELRRLDGDWRALAELYLFSGPEPRLARSLIGDLGHPLIHLAYAYELDNAGLATEALTYCAVHHDPQTARLLDARAAMPAPTGPAPSSPLDVLANLRADPRLAGFPPAGPGRENFAPLLEQHRDVVLEHWRSWPRDDGDDVESLVAEGLDASVALLVGTADDDDATRYDFLLLHALTACHALHVLVPHAPTAAWRRTLLDQWWLLTLTLYAAQGRPVMREAELIGGCELAGRGWEFAVGRAVASPAGFDAHFVKAVRAIRLAGEVGARPREWYLKAATRFADGFRGYKGFGPVDDDMVKQLVALSGQGSSERH